MSMLPDEDENNRIEAEHARKWMPKLEAALAEAAKLEAELRTDLARVTKERDEAVKRYVDESGLAEALLETEKLNHDYTRGQRDEARARLVELEEERDEALRQAQIAFATVKQIREISDAIERSKRWTEEDQPLPEDDAIKNAHPLRSGKHDTYAEAMRLVGAKRSKGALVALVNWLLSERDEAVTRAAVRADELAAVSEQLERQGLCHDDECDLVQDPSGAATCNCAQIGRERRVQIEEALAAAERWREHCKTAQANETRLGTKLASLEAKCERMRSALVAGKQCGACAEGRHADCSGWCFCGCEHSR
jgi:hypothetical protein